MIETRDKATINLSHGSSPEWFPQWLTDLRAQAWQAYLDAPMPDGRAEDWRKVDLNSLEAMSLAQTYAFETQKQLPLEEITSQANLLYKEGVARSAFLHQSPKGSFSEQNEPTLKSGVIFCDLKQAIEKHQDKLRPILEKLYLNSTSDKFTLLNRALFNCGWFLFVPDNVQLESPIIASMAFTADADRVKGDASPTFLHLAVISVGANSSANVINLLEGETSGNTKIVNSGIIDATIGNGGKATYFELSKFDSGTYSLLYSRNRLQANATFKSLSVALGGALVKSDITTVLQDRGSHSQILGVVLGDNNDQYNFNTVQEHKSPDTTSDINFRVALKDSSTSMYRGTIYIDKVAQRTEAYQSNKNLLLGNGAKADSIPKLEILADDVKCSHGATVGPIDQDQVFYLNSRGLPLTEAEELIVAGFFNKVVEQFPLGEIKDFVAGAISDKIHGKN
jgi:Fe-S cluster assembly protein SufD